MCVITHSLAALNRSNATARIRWDDRKLSSLRARSTSSRGNSGLTENLHVSTGTPESRCSKKIQVAWHQYNKAAPVGTAIAMATMRYLEDTHCGHHIVFRDASVLAGAARAASAFMTRAWSPPSATFIRVFAQCTTRSSIALRTADAIRAGVLPVASVDRCPAHVAVNEMFC